MTEQRNALADIFTKCWKDEAFKARFISEPKAVLTEHGLDVPDGMNVSVVENTDSCVHITLPMTPRDVTSLSDSQLSEVAGGSAVNPADPFCP